MAAIFGSANSSSSYDEQPFYVVSVMEFEDGEVVRETQYFGEAFEPGSIALSLSNTSGDVAGRPFLEDGDGKARETVGSAIGGWRAGIVRVGAGRRRRPCGPGSRARQPLVPGSAMGSGLGHQLSLGLESVSRLARSGTGGLGALGTPAAVGAAAAPSAGVGASGAPDVEPDHRSVGILQQRNLDPDLTERRHEGMGMSRCSQPSGGQP